MFEDLDFVEVEGEKGTKEIIVFGTGNCHNFRYSLELLNQWEAAYKYIFLDNCPTSVKRKTKEYLKEHYSKVVLCPFALFGEDEYLTGFKRDEWTAKLREIFPES